jgi:ribonuclease T2
MRLRPGRWLVLFALCLLAVGAGARHHRRAQSGAPGEFDYYLLSLSWSPAFCLSQPGSSECNGPRRFGFIVHGLWPQNERGWPQNCGADQAVPDEVADSILDIMPARKLIFHEWTTHGTCSGLDPAAYFALLRRAYGLMVIPADFREPREALSESPEAVTNAFAAANPGFPAGGLVVTCSSQGAARLREVHACFDRDLKPRACSNDALREACRAPSVIVPPIR